MIKAVMGVLLCALFLSACSNSVDLTTQAAPQIRLSDNTSGLPYTSLDGRTVKGRVYLYVPRHAYLKAVGWVRDGRSIDTDRSFPFSLRPDDGLVDTRNWSEGAHTLTAKYYYRRGGRKWTQSYTARFTVDNEATPVIVDPPEPTQPGRELIFADEFSGSSLDRSKWDACYPWGNEGGYGGFHGTGNCYNRSTGETQLYLPENITVSDGTLKLTAKRETVTRNSKTFSYTSGMIASHPEFGGGFTTRYGYLEASIKMPKGKGLWPAFWTLPYPVSWPPEIDITEVLGDSITTHRMHYHYTGSDGRNASVGKNYVGPDLSADFHTYAVDWRPGLITWYFDGKEVFRTTQSVTDDPMYLLLNLAVDGWAGTPDNNVFPATMSVDFVRVYR